MSIATDIAELFDDRTFHTKDGVQFFDLVPPRASTIEGGPGRWMICYTFEDGSQIVEDSTEWRLYMPQASAAGRECNLPLVPCPTREDLIGWLRRADPNGVWSDEDSTAEGREPLAYAEAARHVAVMLELED